MAEIVSKVQIDVYPSDWMYIHQSEDWGKVKVAITIDPKIIDAMDWVKKYRQQLEDEAKIRAENPAVASQYESYQTMLKLVKSDHIQS